MRYGFPLGMAVSRFGLSAAVLLVGCGSTQSNGGSATGNSIAAACSSNAPLVGAAYDITKSRFAFGPTRTEQVSGGLRAMGRFRWRDRDLVGWL
jgi:hypothetical protein